MKLDPRFVVYVAGVVLLGLFHGPIKSATGGQGLFLVCVVGYLLSLRVVGAILAKALSGRKRGHGG